MYKTMQRWTSCEVDKLKILYPDLNCSVGKLAEILNRTELSIRMKAVNLTITRGIKRWQSENDEFLKRNYRKIGIKKCAEILGYSVDHIQGKVVERGLSKKLTYWTDEEIRELKELSGQHLTLSEIAKRLNKSIPQVKNRMRLSKINACWWTESELEYLKKNYASHNAEEIARILKRTKIMIYRKASELGITQEDNSGKNHYAFIEKHPAIFISSRKSIQVKFPCCGYKLLIEI